MRIYQVKTSYYEKPIQDTVAALIEKSREYTFERYGETEYIFVNEKDPKRPFQYSMLKNKVYAMIYENDIRNDAGELMGFGQEHCHQGRVRHRPAPVVRLYRLRHRGDPHGAFQQRALPFAGDRLFRLFQTLTKS